MLPWDQGQHPSHGPRGQRGAQRAHTKGGALVKNRFFRKSFFTSASAAALMLAVPLAGFAQDDDDDDISNQTVVGEEEQVYVFGRRRLETMEEIPASVTVLTESTLESAGVKRAEDFIRLTPGVTIVNAAEVGDTQVNIRGINGARDAENSFAFIVDGILLTNPAAFNREFVDLQQIEILKGPQGALYGRNAAAGAIIVTTRAPDNEFRASGTASYANHDSFYGSATLSGPLTEDQLYFQVHFDYRKTDGFYTNTFRNEPADRFENFNISGRLLWQPNSQTSVDIKVRYGEVDASAITFNAAFALENFANVLGSPAAFEDVNAHQFVFQNNIRSDNNQETFEISVKLERDMDWATLTAWFLYNDIKNNLIADGTSASFGFFAFDAGVTDANGQAAFDACESTTLALFNAGFQLPPPQFLGSSPVPVLLDPFTGSFFGPYSPTTCDGIQEQVRNQSDISFEVRLASPSNQRLRWEVGAYFLDLNRTVGVSLNTDDGNDPIRGLLQFSGSSPNFTEALVFDKFDSTVFAFFANASYDVTDDVELTVALRYDNERRKVTNLVPINVVTQFIDFDGDFVPGGSPLNPALLFNPGGVPPQSRTFSQVEPKFSLSWDATPELTFFASWGVGFKSGGFNNVGSQATIDIFINDFIALVDTSFAPVIISDNFNKETSSAFEVGFKGRFMDGKLTIQGAFYHTSVDDMQFFEFFVGPFGLLRVVNNIDNVKIKGFEFAAQAQLHEYFFVGAGFNVIDSKITKFDSRPDTIGNKSPYTADYTINVSAEFNYPVQGDMSFFARADARWVGDTWFHAVQNQERQTIFGPLAALFFCPQLSNFPGCDASLGIGNFAKTKRDAFVTLDLRIGIETESWSIVGFAKNLTNKSYLEEVIPAIEFGGSFIHPGSLRTIGVEIKGRF